MPPRSIQSRVLSSYVLRRSAVRARATCVSTVYDAVDEDARLWWQQDRSEYFGGNDSAISWVDQTSSKQDLLWPLRRRVARAARVGSYTV